MNAEQMGLFISELRKSHKMTQKELAEKLNISDKAVSKWERGLSCPDISLLSPLSDILGVTTTELLNSARADSQAVDMEAMVVNALEYGNKAIKRKLTVNQSIIAAVYSVFLLIGIFVVSVVDIAVSGAFTWSVIPISAAIFAWLVFFPAIRFGAKGIIGSLISVSVFIVPFLYVLNHAISKLLGASTLVFRMGVRIAPLAVVFLWAAFFLFKKLKARKLLAVAILVLLASPVTYFTNAMISGLLNQPQNGAAVVLNIFSPVIAAAILFIIDLVRRRKTCI